MKEVVEESPEVLVWKAAKSIGKAGQCRGHSQGTTRKAFQESTNRVG